MRSGRLTRTWKTVCASNIGIWSISWKPPVPMPSDPVSGVMATTGECAQKAAAIAETKLAAPGPFCAMQAWGRPVTRASPSAACAAACSCATEMKRMPASGNRSRASMNADPTSPNTSVTPSATSVSTSASEGVIVLFGVSSASPASSLRLPPAGHIQSGVGHIQSGERSIGRWV